MSRSVLLSVFSWLSISSLVGPVRRPCLGPACTGLSRASVPGDQPVSLVSAGRVLTRARHAQEPLRSVTLLSSAGPQGVCRLQSQQVAAHHSASLLSRLPPTGHR